MLFFIPSKTGKVRLLLFLSFVISLKSPTKFLTPIRAKANTGKIDPYPVIPAIRKKLWAARNNGDKIPYMPIFFLEYKYANIINANASILP